MEFYKDWITSKKAIIEDQARRQEKERENNKKLLELNKNYDLIQSIFDKLSKEQQEMLKNFPKTKEDLEKFNEIGDDLEEKEEKLNEIWVEIDAVINELPFSDEELVNKFKEVAMEVMKKHHLNN
jgi:uncharacterized protein YoxC